LWENDRRNLARLMVRARVTNFTNVPHFIVLTESEGFEGESWTIQYEILQQEILGGCPTDEDPILVLEPNGQPPLFDFFVLGQLGQPPFNPGLANNEEENVNNVDFNIQPEEHEEQLIIGLNLEPDGEGLNYLIMEEQDGLPDLNEEPFLDVNANQVLLHPKNAQLIRFAPQNQAQDIP
jgi:hypothetical protein